MKLDGKREGHGANWATAWSVRQKRGISKFAEIAFLACSHPSDGKSGSNLLEMEQGVGEAASCIGRKFYTRMRSTGELI